MTILPDNVNTCNQFDKNCFIWISQLRGTWCKLMYQKVLYNHLNLGNIIFHPFKRLSLLPILISMLTYPGLDFVEVCRRGSNFVNKWAIIYLYWAKLNFWTVQFCNKHRYDNFFASRLTLMMIRRFAWGNLLRSYEVWQHSIALNKRLCMCRQVLRIINDYLMNQ